VFVKEAQNFRRTLFNFAFKMIQQITYREIRFTDLRISWFLQSHHVCDSIYINYSSQVSTHSRTIHHSIIRAGV
jgi:hypothetical protein